MLWVIVSQGCCFWYDTIIVPHKYPLLYLALGSCNHLFDNNFLMGFTQNAPLLWCLSLGPQLRSVLDSSAPLVLTFPFLHSLDLANVSTFNHVTWHLECLVAHAQCNCWSGLPRLDPIPPHLVVLDMQTHDKNLPASFWIGAVLRPDIYWCCPQAGEVGNWICEAASCLAGHINLAFQLS